MSKPQLPDWGWTTLRRGPLCKPHCHAANSPPVEKRIADAVAFTARAQKRVATESANQKQIFEEELAQAEKDWPPSDERPRWRRSADQVLRRIACLRWRLSSHRSARSWPSRRGSGQSPICHVDRASNGSAARTGRVVPAESSAWLEDRHADLHDAFFQGDNTRAVELSTKLSEGAERMVEMTGGMPMCGGCSVLLCRGGARLVQGMDVAPRTTCVAKVPPGNEPNTCCGDLNRGGASGPRQKCGRDLAVPASADVPLVSNSIPVQYRCAVLDSTEVVVTGQFGLGSTVVDGLESVAKVFPMTGDACAEKQHNPNDSTGGWCWFHSLPAPLDQDKTDSQVFLGTTVTSDVVLPG